MTILIIALLFLFLLAAWALSPTKISREPEREGPQEGEAVTAYERASRWPVFSIERSIILDAMKLDKPQGLLLDIGCGPGFLAAAISRRATKDTVVGLDINQQMVNIAKRRWQTLSNLNLAFLTGDAHQLPIKSNSVDYVVSSLSLHHWKDACRVFLEIHRVLKPGGNFIVFDLRRDAPLYFYGALKIGQAIAAPRAIKQTNGAVGSFWSSFTPSEVKTILDKTPIVNPGIEPHFGWMIIRGSKSQQRSYNF